MFLIINYNFAVTRLWLAMYSTVVLHVCDHVMLPTLDSRGTSLGLQVFFLYYDKLVTQYKNDKVYFLLILSSVWEVEKAWRQRLRVTSS